MNTLDNVELAFVQARILKLPGGVYEASEIYGEGWEDLYDKSGYGRRFLRSVRNNLLKNIRYHDRLLNNHRTYEIYQ